MKRKRSGKVGMAATGEPRVYFLRSKTVCGGQELKFVCRPRTDSWSQILEECVDEDIRVPPSMQVPSEDVRRQDEQIADLGLTLLNLGARQYKLVRAGFSSVFVTSKYSVYHGNFEAKLAADCDAPTELFFVELLLRGGGRMEKPIRAYVLENLGCSDTLRDVVDGNDHADNVTTKCPMCCDILHPKNVKLYMMPTK